MYVMLHWNHDAQGIMCVSETKKTNAHVDALETRVAIHISLDVRPAVRYSVRVTDKLKRNNT